MAFKIPLPKFNPSHHMPQSNNFRHVDLPTFNKTDLTDVNLIGQGAFGKVFKCKKNGITYVMKQLEGSTDKVDIQLLVKEALMLRSLKGHENVVEIRGFSPHDKALLLDYICFSFDCLGIHQECVSTLKDLLDACDAINNFTGFEHLQLHIASDVSAGLEYLHSRNVAHRDLKPANVLVSNSHYASTSDVSSYWSVRPVIAKLSDFGESRSCLLQTRSILVSATGRLNRGSPAYMAPEAGHMSAACTASLLVMDVWSFAMTLYNLLNPNVKYPYALEMEKKATDVDACELLKLMHVQKTLPADAPKYMNYHKSIWQPLHTVYRMCAQFDPANRPSAKDISNLIADSYVIVKSLTLREKTDVPDRNDQIKLKCNQLNAADADFSFVNFLTSDLSAYDAYNINQSPELCSRYDITFPLCSTNPTNTSEAKRNLSMCLFDVLTDQTFSCAIYTVLPHSVLFFKDTSGRVALYTQLDGNSADVHNRGTVVSALNEETTVSCLSNWLFNRMKLIGDICYKLAVLKPLPSQSLQVNDSTINDQCSHQTLDSTHMSSDCLEGDCSDDDLLDDMHCDTNNNTSPSNWQRIQNRWGSSDNTISNWQSCEEELVERLPYDINGLRKFRIICNAQDKSQVMKMTKDGRPWQTWVSSSRKGFNGYRRIAKCRGGFTCTSSNCPFFLEHSKQNNIHFRKQTDAFVCFVCDVPAKNTPCPAVKIWEFDDKYCNAVVYHRGEHTCAAKKRTCLSNAAILKAVRQNPSVGPSKMVHNELMTMMSGDDFMWSEIETVADNLADIKRVQYERQKVMQYCTPCGENFEALGILRQKCMEKDKFFIYKVNDRSLNGLPSFVFKSSTHMANLAMDMDRDGNGIMKDEFAFVDAKHDRCRNFKSITLWTYHPVLRKLLQLAVMEVEQENCENLTHFWNLLNEMLQTASGMSDYKFNPCGFVADEHHANWNSIRDVFGEDAVARVVSCEFHFKQSVQRHAKALQQATAQEFVSVAENMLTALTVSEFNDACKELQNIVKQHDCLQQWYEWWHKRRMHIFRAFKPDNVPLSNLAEVGHAKMAAVGHPYMSLLAAAKDDVATAIRQEAELRLFPAGVASGGKGTSVQQRLAGHYQTALKRAKGFAKELDDLSKIAHPATYVPKSGLHRPPNIRSSNYRTSKIPVKPSAVKAKQVKAAAKVRPTNFEGKKIRTVNKSPLTFNVVFINNMRNVKKCYGCGKEFATMNSKKPIDLILQHFCRRKYRNKDGVEVLSPNPQAVYFHMNLNCARKCRPDLELTDIIVHDEVRPLMTDKQVAMLLKFGIQV